eukprot:Sspe_Gene.33745::Locus_16450_Transcript_1_1_Confidence_1.000_Length_6022::g.33745::m.33745
MGAAWPQKRRRRVLVVGPPEVGKTELVRGWEANAPPDIELCEFNSPFLESLEMLPAARPSLTHVLDEAAAVVFVLDALERTPERVRLCGVLLSEVANHLAVGKGKGATPLLVVANNVPPPLDAYRYYRIVVRAVRGGLRNGMVQIAGVELEGASVARWDNPGGSHPETAPRAGDGNRATCWKDGFLAPLVMELSSLTKVTAYRITPGPPEGQPVKWSFEASPNGLEWVVVDFHRTAPMPTDEWIQLPAPPTPEEVAEKYRIPYVARGVVWKVVCCSSGTGDGLKEALRWLVSSTTQ